MTDFAWPDISCWLAAELIDLPDRRPAVLGDFLALAQAGHVDVAAGPEAYTLDLRTPDARTLPVEHVELLHRFADGRNRLVRQGGQGSERIQLPAMRTAGRRTAAGRSLTRRALPGLTAKGKEQRQRILELPARLPGAHADAGAVPWARMFLGDDAFLEWYRAHVARYGPPGWLSWDGMGTGDPAGPEGVGGLLAALRNEIIDGRPQQTPPPARDYFRPQGEKALPVAAPATAQHPWAATVTQSYLLARAAIGADAAGSAAGADVAGSAAGSAAGADVAGSAAGSAAAADAVGSAAGVDVAGSAAGADAAGSVAGAEVGSPVGAVGEADALAREEAQLARAGLVGGADETARAIALVHRREALAAADPERHEPLLGLSLALWAHVLVVAGRADQGRAVAHRAVDVLEPYWDRREGIAQAQALAYGAIAAAGFRAGRFVAAERALVYAVDLLRTVEGFATDLAHYEALLGDAGLRLVAGEGLGQADESLARGIELGRQGRFAEAADTLADAVDRIAALTNPRLAPDAATRWHRALTRRGGRAQWRHALVLHSLGRSEEALRVGQKALAILQTIMQLSPERSDEKAACRAEYLTVLADVAEITVAGGDAERGLRLIDSGIKLVRDDRGAIEQETLRALGTLLHNKANTMAVDLVRRVRAGSALPYTTRDLAEVIGDAAEIRERLAGVDGLAVWELANTVQLAAQIANLSGDRRAAVELVCRAGALCARLGPAADGIVTSLSATGDVLAQEAPAEVAAARATGRWPLP